ncbi:TruB pseudouridylate synthase (N terminal domain) family protein [Penicillium angulare]|uniref:TruB pseudouridylate synthase (N terminal domain) family protein n=1 Tax=Penicillium angulare TaxID=116970 RepID=A0A9W9KIR2_9EURO|nr:TruB pseudouridylate synthase (N terminal domain) family protein [Penicillium angulare]
MVASAGNENHDEYYEDEIAPPIQSIISKYGQPPLAGTSLASQPLSHAGPDTVLAMILDVMIKSRPISHDLTRKTLTHLVDAGYHHIDILSSTTWEERTRVLSEGGYNRYREQCATNLGTLADFVSNRYDGDLNNLLEAAHGDREETRKLVKEIKGVGDLGVELFFNDVQSVWPSIAPFLDSRSLNTADEIGIGRDLDAIYGVLGHEPEDMSLLANGLSQVRLEKKRV